MKIENAQGLLPLLPSGLHPLTENSLWTQGPCGKLPWHGRGFRLNSHTLLGRLYFLLIYLFRSYISFNNFLQCLRLHDDDCSSERSLR